MNYIKQINAFYNRIEQEPLASSSVSLWYTLMHINNKAMWQESFTVSGTVLKYKGGLSDSAFKRARNELQEKGYITWESRGRNLAPVYRMVSLAFESDDDSDKGNPHEPDFSYGAEASATVSDAEPTIDFQENAVHPSESMQAGETDASAWRVSDQNETFPNDADTPDPIFDPDAIGTRATSKTESNNLQHNDTPSFISETNATYPNKHTNHRSSIDTHSEPYDDTNPLPGRYVDHHTDRSMDHNMDQSAGHLSDHERDPLVKQDKTKDETKPKETKKAAAAVLHFFEDNFGVAGPFVKASIVSWLEDLGEGLVLRAMERSLESGKVTWAYTKGILRAWLDKGIRSVGDARLEESAFRRDRWHSGKGAGRVLSGEVVPDWFRELERKRDVVPARECVDVRDEAEVLRETQAMLDAFVGV